MIFRLITARWKLWRWRFYIGLADIASRTAAGLVVLSDRLLEQSRK